MENFQKHDIRIIITSGPVERALEVRVIVNVSSTRCDKRAFLTYIGY